MKDILHSKFENVEETSTLCCYFREEVVWLGDF